MQNGLQQKTTDEQGNVTWITAKTEQLDANGNVVRDAQGNPVMVDNVLTLENFSAETMEKIGEFGPVSLYDAEGRLLEFRVVQTYVSRTDKGITGESDVQIQNGAVNQDLNLISAADHTTVTDQYKVSVVKDILIDENI